MWDLETLLKLVLFYDGKKIGGTGFIIPETTIFLLHKAGPDSDPSLGV
jgi:hypothetical protein